MKNETVLLYGTPFHITETVTKCSPIKLYAGLAALRVNEEPVPVTVVFCTRQLILLYWLGLSTDNVADVGPPLVIRYKVGPIMFGASSII